jgi:hypothetical protein
VGARQARAAAGRGQCHRSQVGLRRCRPDQLEPQHHERRPAATARSGRGAPATVEPHARWLIERHRARGPVLGRWRLGSRPGQPCRLGLVDTTGPHRAACVCRCAARRLPYPRRQCLREHQAHPARGAAAGRSLWRPNRLRRAAPLPGLGVPAFRAPLAGTRLLRAGRGPRTGAKNCRQPHRAVT